jgi:opacity protein-like surface antigen
MLKRTLLFGLALLVVVPQAAAFDEKHKFEITPMIGYRLGGTVDGNQQIAPGIQQNDLRLEDSESYGLAFGVSFGEHWQLEFYFNEAPTTLTVNTPDEGRVDVTDVKVDYWQVGGLYQFGMSESSTRPFFSFSAGVINLRPETAGFGSETEFSWSLGGGAKFWFSDNIGLRLEGKFQPTYINSDPAWFCGWYGWCYNVGSANYLVEWQLNAGLAIGF